MIASVIGPLSVAALADVDGAGVEVALLNELRRKPALFDLPAATHLDGMPKMVILTLAGLDFRVMQVLQKSLEIKFSNS